jgi:hypothetical protein
MCAYARSLPQLSRLQCTTRRGFETLRVLADGIPIGSFDVWDPDYQTYTTPAFTFSASGYRTFRFEIFGPNIGSRAILVDEIVITPVTTISMPTANS